MSANFTPTRGAYTELKPFRFWCQKVLPLVYDDSLSYYELLCKVVDYLNKTMEDVETLEDDVTNLFTAYTQLQNYVNTYFDQEFPDLVSDKLDEMAEDGTLTALITPVVTDTIDEQLPGEVAEKIGDTVAGQIGPVVAGQIGGTVSTQIGPVVANQIGPVVADWLEDNMSATTPAVDRTLSILNAAADAAFTGARLDSVDSAVGYDHISDVGAIITTATPCIYNYGYIVTTDSAFSDGQSHTYKVLEIPVATGDKYRINAHKISIANVTADHFAVTYAFCAKWVDALDPNNKRYYTTAYNSDAVVDAVVTAPEIEIPTGQGYDETTGYLVVITADIQDPVYKVTDGFARESEVNALKDDLNYAGVWSDNVTVEGIDGTVINNNGSAVESSNFYSVKLDVTNITKIKAKVGQSSPTYNAISFFYTDTIMQSTFISGIPYEVLGELKTYEVAVPDKAVCALITTRKVDLATPKISVYNAIGTKANTAYNNVLKVTIPVIFEQGGINTTGAEIVSNQRCRSGFISSANFEYGFINGTLALWIAEYDIHQNFISLKTGNNYNGYKYIDSTLLDQNCKYIRLVAIRNENITPENVDVHFYRNIRQEINERIFTEIHTSVLSGKKISIYGDSISTYAGWVPEGNAVWYNGSNGGVSNVSQTWWYEVMQAIDLELVVNNSWSGRAVSSCRDNTSGHETDAGYKEVNVLQLKNGDVLPEIIIIKMGINDFIDNCELGTYDGSTALPTTPTKFLDAYAIMLNLIMTNYPLAKVYVCTLMACERNLPTGFPEINTRGDSIGMWNEAIKKLAHAFGAEILDHDQCGITYYNLSSYMGDYQTTGTALHPNPAGHALIANKTIEQMDNFVRTRFI